jgi:chromate reductase, NAD(P)H dehydrogenase (quinone)
MTNAPKILAFAGSLRKNSFNKKISQIAALGAKEAGASVTYIDLKDYPIPLYDEEIEEKGLPENVLKLKELFSSHDGFIIASPEYNGSFSAVLKNTIDWVSRKKSAEDPSLSCFRNKVAVLLSASPGPLGGVRGLIALRQLLSTVHTLVLPEQKTIPSFDSKENLSEKDQQAIEKIGALLTQKLLLLNL